MKKENESSKQKLSKEEMKKIMGGMMQGTCYTVFGIHDGQNLSSCWYSTTSGSDLCHRVYGYGCMGYFQNSCGDDCIMN